MAMAGPKLRFFRSRPRLLYTAPAPSSFFMKRWSKPAKPADKFTFWRCLMFHQRFGTRIWVHDVVCRILNWIFTGRIPRFAWRSFKTGQGLLWFSAASTYRSEDRPALDLPITSCVFRAANLLHAVLDGDVGVRRARCAARCGRLHQDLQ